MKILSKLLIVLSVLFGTIVVFAPDTAFAACTSYVGKDGGWYAEGTTENGSGAKEAPTDCKAESDMMGKVLRYIKILSGLVIVAAVGMIIYSGLKYITSQGDPKAIETAKQQLWYSGVGLFVVLTAFTILKLFESASGY